MATMAALVVAARDGGFGTAQLPTAVAVAMGAGGDENATGGAWGVGGPAGDVAGQGKAAFAAYQAQGWDAFPAHRNGRYALFLPAAAAAVATVAQVKGAEAIANAPAAAANAGAASSGALGGIGETFAVVHWLTTPDAWIRVVKLGIGAVLIGIAAIAVTNATVGRRMRDTLIGAGRTAGYVAQETAGVVQGRNQTQGRGWFQGRY